MKRAAALLAALGLLSMLGQVALLRELAVASFGVELVYVAGTALWLAAGAGGALAGRRRPPPGRDSLAAGLIALALLLPAEAAFLRGARTLFGGVPGAYLPLGQQLATAALGLMPAGAVLGWLFRAAAVGLGGAGGTLAAAYAWESAGGALGSVAATAALAAGVPNLSLLVAAAAAAALAAALAHPTGPRRGPLALAALGATALPFVPALDLWTAAWNHPHLAAVADTAYGRLALVESQGQRVLFENDALAWDSDGTDAEPLVHLAALQARERPRVLVLEGGATGIIREVLKHRPERTVSVTVDAAAQRFLLPWLPEEDRAALTAPGVELRSGDPRAFLRRVEERFDLIFVGAPEPSSGVSNRLYTVEFFRRCADRLAPGGILALRLPSSEDFQTPGLLLRNGSVHAALRAALRDVLVLPGATDVLLASDAPLERDGARLAARLVARGVTAREVTPQFVRWLLDNDRTAAAGPRLARAAAPINRDTRPLVYTQTARLWLGRLLGGAQDARPPGPGAAVAVLSGIALLAAAARRGEATRRGALVAIAALAGMLIEAVILLRYQAEAGALYRDIGLLLTSFMLGLALGASGWDRARAWAGPLQAGAWIPTRTFPLAGLALLALAVAGASRSGLAAGLVPSSGVLLATGALVAAAFAAASDRGELAANAGALYAADLLGGCAGSLLAAGPLVATLSLTGTSLAASALAGAALLLLR